MFNRYFLIVKELVKVYRLFTANRSFNLCVHFKPFFLSCQALFYKFFKLFYKFFYSTYKAIFQRAYLQDFALLLSLALCRLLYALFLPCQYLFLKFFKLF